MSSLDNAKALLAKLKAGDASVLSQLKIAMLDFPSPPDAAHMSVATEALEWGVLSTVNEGDLDAFARSMAQLKPWSVTGLIATVVLLFGCQAQTIVDKPLVIAMIAVPLVLQTYGIFFIAWWGARRLKLPHNVAGPACLIGTSNFFELAVAVAISLFGLNSGAALATVVGVLVEVPVMLSLVALVNRWAPRKEKQPSA